MQDDPGGVASRRAVLKATSAAIAGAVGGLAGTGTARGQADGGWRQYKVGAANAGTVPGGGGSVASSSVAWTVDAVIPTYPVVAGETLYCSSAQNPTMYAVDVRSGELRWTADIGSAAQSMPATDGDRVYAPRNGGVIALEASDGSTAWTTPLDGYISGVTLAGGRLFTTSQHATYALDPGSGEILWSFRADRTPRGGYTHDLPAVVDGTVYATARNNTTLVALSAADGSLEWESAPRESRDGMSVPLVLGDQVFVRNLAVGVNGESQVVALDRASGETNWTTGVAGNQLSALATDGTTLFANSWAGLLSFDAASGEKSVVHEADFRRTGLTVGPDHVFVNADEGVLAIDQASGEVAGRVEPRSDSASATSEPVVTPGGVYFTTGSTIHGARPGADLSRQQGTATSTATGDGGGGLPVFSQFGGGETALGVGAVGLGALAAGGYAAWRRLRGDGE